MTMLLNVGIVSGAALRFRQLSLFPIPCCMEVLIVSHSASMARKPRYASESDDKVPKTQEWREKGRNKSWWDILFQFNDLGVS